MDIVIPIGKGSTWYDNETRWFLRSVEKYVGGLRNIVIVGELPYFLKDVIHIACPDGPRATKNIMQKVLAACGDERVSADFFFCNDDYFFLKPVSVKNFPNYYARRIEDAIRARKFRDRYRVSQENTVAALKEKSFDTLQFDIHVPIVYNKKKFKEAMEQYDWNVLHGYMVKSLYANTVKLPATEMDDCKIDAHILRDDLLKKIEGRFIFSHGERGLNRDVKELMHEHCPEASRWEKEF